MLPNTVIPSLDAPTRATLEAEIAQATQNPLLRPLLAHAPDLWPSLTQCYRHLTQLPRQWWRWRHSQLWQYRNNPKYHHRQHVEHR